MSTLITGGAGYIGSTVASALLDHGIVPVILDDLSAGPAEFTQGRFFHRGDIADGLLVDRIFDQHPDIDSVIHCAARISVPESVDHPLAYFRNNVSKTVNLLDHLLRNGCSRMIFSSSAAVYAPDAGPTVDETSPVGPGSPYALSKLMVEKVLDSVAGTGRLKAISLRYFNPVGVDPQLRTGPREGRVNHAMGALLQSWLAAEPFTITGTTWPTRDGSGIRDFVHVWDLARAHVQALLRFDDIVSTGIPHEVINLGSGTGTTVRELVRAFQLITGGRLDIRESGPRPGDVAGAYCASDKAERLLGWTPQLTIQDAIGDSLAWQRRRALPAARTSDLVPGAAVHPEDASLALDV